MIGSALKKLAAENGMTVESGAAYGYLQGCFVTLTEGAGYKRMSIYVGGQVSAQDGVDMDSPTVVNAKNIAGMIAAASGEENIYRLMTKHKNISALVVNHGGSVVTVNFFDNPGTMECINRFVAEMLPQIAPLCCPGQCICCCADTADCGFPVMIAADTVVPMHGQCMDAAIDMHQSVRTASSGNLFGGIAGALVGSLLGAIVWAVVYCFGYVAGIVGLLSALLASYGYDLLKGKPGIIKVVTVILSVILSVVLGTALGVAWPMHQEYASLGSVVQGMMSEFTFIKTTFRMLLQDSEVMTSLGKDVLTGLFFAALGCVDMLRKNISGSADASKPKQLSGQL